MIHRKPQWTANRPPVPYTIYLSQWITCQKLLPNVVLVGTRTYPPSASFTPLIGNLSTHFTCPSSKMTWHLFFMCQSCGVVCTPMPMGSSIFFRLQRTYLGRCIIHCFSTISRIEYSMTRFLMNQVLVLNNMDFKFPSIRP